MANFNVSYISRKGGSCHEIRIRFSAIKMFCTDFNVHFGLFGFCIPENFAEPLVHTLDVDIIL